MPSAQLNFKLFGYSFRSAHTSLLCICNENVYMWSEHGIIIVPYLSIPSEIILSAARSTIFYIFLVRIKISACASSQPQQQQQRPTCTSTHIKLLVFIYLFFSVLAFILFFYSVLFRGSYTFGAPVLKNCMNRTITWLLYFIMMIIELKHWIWDSNIRIKKNRSRRRRMARSRIRKKK